MFAQSTIAGKAVVAPRAAARRSAARTTAVKVQARDAPWCPGTEAPAYLNGSIPGDYGFDPLGLGQEPAALAKFQENEIINGRWAMLAVPGIFATELLGYGTWLDAPKWALTGQNATYLGNDVGAPSIVNLLVTELVLMGIVEGLRAKEGDLQKRLYPGFDPAGLAKDPKAFEELKLKEVKNGRLAMLALAGFFSQGAVTGDGVFTALAKHIADPWNYNVATSNPVAIPPFHTEIYSGGINTYWASALPSWLPGL